MQCSIISRCKHCGASLRAAYRVRIIIHSCAMTILQTYTRTSNDWIYSPLLVRVYVCKIVIAHECIIIRTRYAALRLAPQCLHRLMKSTKVLNPRRCIMRVYTREIRMRVHEKYAWKNGRLGMAIQRRECWISATERFQRKPHKFFDLRCPLST